MNGNLLRRARKMADKKYFVVKCNHSPLLREAHLKAMEKEKATSGQSPYWLFLPENMAKERISHIEYNRALKKEGKLLCAGPVTDYSWALIIYAVESEEEAKTLIEGDPFFKCGYFTDYEIYGWYNRI